MFMLSSICVFSLILEAVELLGDEGLMNEVSFYTCVEIPPGKLAELRSFCDFRMVDCL